MKKFILKNKRIWITGASSGIGASLAEQLNAQGAEVIISARRQDKLYKIAEACRFPESVSVIPLDITNQENIEEAVAQVKGMGQLDLIIHNAGIAQKGLVTDNRMEVDRKIMETNYFGTVALTKALLPIFIDQGFGYIGVVSSIAGIVGVPGRSAYAASKHALQGYFDSLKAEHLDCNLDVSFIIPGFINTNITKKELIGNGTQYGKKEKSHRLGMTAEACATGIIRKLVKKQKQIIVGRIEILIIYIKRVSPTLCLHMLKNHPMKNWRKLVNAKRRVLQRISNLFRWYPIPQV